MRHFKFPLLLLMQLLKTFVCEEVFEECSSIGCVHASARLLDQINNDTKPCDDFYEFACGTFLRKTYTPDEKFFVNIETLLVDQLDEHLFRILNKPVRENEPRSHKAAKKFYENCMDLDRIKMLENQQLLDLLNYLGGWPVVTKTWNEKTWSWEKTLLKLRRFAGVGNEKNIFRMNSPDGLSDDELNEAHKPHRIKRANIDDDIDNDATFHDKYSEYMLEMAVLLGADNSNETKNEINRAFQLGLALNELLSGKMFKETSFLNLRAKNKLQSQLDLLKWMEIFDHFKIKTTKNSLIDYNRHELDNLGKLKKEFKTRDFANFVMWRIVDFSTQFLHDAAQDKIGNLYRKTYGVLDKEQRWKLCTRMTNRYAALAAGSLYIRDYFPEKSRAAAIDMAKIIIENFKATIRKSEWMDENIQKKALETVKNLTVHMGYDEKLLDIKEVEKYYGKPKYDFFHSFFYLGVQLNTHQADKTFLHRFRKQNDWTEYAKPTTSKASYNLKDNTIYFAAAFLQAPNFDKDRPQSMNFGAIGSIIAHELTHCFDRVLDKDNLKDEKFVEKYKAKLNCIVEQYDNFTDPDLNWHLNGTVTIREDTADNGGIKLAYRAYEEWLGSTSNTQTRLIALDFTPRQLFWISYAQFYCSVERKELKIRNVDSFEVHSFDRFRVMGPLINSQEFAQDFNCPIKSRMNPDRERCAIW